jgi:hypothetical protein
MGTLLGVLRALGRLENLDAFLPDPGPSPIQLAKLQGKERQRASGPREAIVKEEAKEGWKWGDEE